MSTKTLKKPRPTTKKENCWGIPQYNSKDSRILDNEMRDYANKINKTFQTKNLAIELEHHTFHYNLEPHLEPMEYSYATPLDLEPSFIMVCTGKYEVYDKDPNTLFPRTPEAIINPTKKEIQTFAESLAKICKQNIISIKLSNIP